MRHSNLTEPDRDYRNALWLAIVLTALPVLGVAAVKVFGQEAIRRYLPPCMFHLLTGCNCLTCGATRATLALLKGDLLTAVYYNPLYMLFLLWCVWFYLRLVLSLMSRPYRRFSVNLTMRKVILLSAVLLGYVILRNTPFFRAIFY